LQIIYLQAFVFISHSLKKLFLSAPSKSAAG